MTPIPEAREEPSLFEVHSFSPLDDIWEERDRTIYRAAARKSDRASAGSSSRGQAEREHIWLVATLQLARNLKKRLENVPGIKFVMLREE